MALVLLLALTAAEPANLLANGDFTDGLAGWRMPPAGVATVSLVDGPDGRRAVRIETVVEAGTKPYAVQTLQDLASAVRKDDRLELSFLARSPGSARVGALVQQAGQPWTKSLFQELRLSPDWRRYAFTAKALAEYPAGAAQAGFFLAYDSGVVELAEVRLVDLDDPGWTYGPRPTLEAPLPMIANGDFAAGLEGWSAAGATSEVVAAPERPGGCASAVRLSLSPTPGGPAWQISFGQSCPGAAMRQDAVYFRAWLRSPDRCRATVVYELGQPPHHKDINQPIALTPDWREYRFVGRARQTYRPGEAQLRFHLGHDAGVVEIAGVRLENHGPAPGQRFDQTIDYWAGRAHDDSWKPAALERIERLRKGDLSVRVVDAAGRPVPGAQVSVTQLRHHFRFGTAAPAALLTDTRTADGRRFREEVLARYNTITFENDLKWAAEDERRLRQAEEAAAWLHANGLEVRGHCLVWGSYKHLAQPVRELRGAALRQAVERHVRDYAARFRDTVYLWDVVNEAGSNTEVWDEVGWETFADVFRWARETAPAVKLAYNDYSILRVEADYRDKVAQRVRYLLDHGAPVDVLGIQAHMGTPLTPIATALANLDAWARFGPALEITEFDLSLTDDALHGTWTRDFLIAAFSHPKVTAFIQWGFWEGAHWKGADGAAMIRRDWSKRPAAEAYDQLVRQDWWTRWQGATDATGQAALRAFHGRHRVTARHGAAEAATDLDLAPGVPAVVTLHLT